MPKGAVDESSAKPAGFSSNAGIARTDLFRECVGEQAADLESPPV